MHFDILLDHRKLLADTVMRKIDIYLYENDVVKKCGRQKWEASETKLGELGFMPLFGKNWGW